MIRTLLATVLVVGAAALAACGDDDGGASEGSVDPVTASYCELVKKSVDLQGEVGPNGPTSEQDQVMVSIAARLRAEAPAELNDAYEALDERSGDDVDAFRAYNEAMNEWTKANCAFLADGA